MGVRREAREALAAGGLRARKRWGQHFLCDPAVARRIVDTAEVGPETTVLEIGPGLGALSDELAERAGQLHLLEIDRGLAARLRERYAERSHVRVIEGDVLEVPLADLIPEPRATVVSNLPYNISTPIVFLLRDLRARFPRAVLMLQREVAMRLAARPGSADYGVTSVLVQAVAEVRVVFVVSRRSFLPPPQVDSAVIDVRWSDGLRVDVKDAGTFEGLVRAAFGQRRKMLRNALADFLATHGENGATAFARAGIDPTARAETLDLAAFARLADAVVS